MEEKDLRLVGQFVSSLLNRILKPSIPYSTLMRFAACLLLKASATAAEFASFGISPA
jgi:hypothetical protein